VSAPPFTPDQPCVPSAVIGGTACYRPSEPWEFGWGHPSVPVLCAKLICRACSTPVRSVAAHALPHHAAETRIATRPIDFAGRKVDLVPALRLKVDEAARTYACACRAVSVRGAQRVGDALPDGARLPWVCAGHPAMPKPADATLDGAPLPHDAPGWLRLAEDALSGQWPTQRRGRDVHDRAHPAFRLAHLFIHLRDETLQRALGRRIAAWGLFHAEARIRFATVDLYRLLPLFFGHEQLGEALTREHARYDEVLAWEPDGPELGGALREAVDLQCAAGGLKEPLSTAIRSDLLAGRGCSAFVRTVVRDTPDWAIQRARHLGSHSGIRRAVLREAMATFHPGRLGELDAALLAG
jgi:hypothetical protein